MPSSRTSFHQPGDTVLAFGLASWRGRPDPFDRFHRHQEIELILVERGALDYVMNARPVRLVPGRLAVFWGSTPHRLVAASSDAILHWLTVPLARFLSWKLPAEQSRPIIAGSLLVEAAERADRDLASFQEWHRDLAARDDERSALVLLEVEARLRRFASTVVLRRKTRASARTSGAGPIERMMSFVAEHGTGDIAIADIAAAARLHPDYASALFRRTAGIGLAAYLTQHRVAHAQRLLATTGMQVLDIAFASGFGSASRFYAVFSRECGQTPRRFRAAVGGGAP